MGVWSRRLRNSASWTRLNRRRRWPGFSKRLITLSRHTWGRSGATGNGRVCGRAWGRDGNGIRHRMAPGDVGGRLPGPERRGPAAAGVRARSGADGRPALRGEAQLHEQRDYLAALAGGDRRRLSYSRVDPVTRRAQYPSPWLLEAASTLAGERVSSERLHTCDAPWLTVIESMEDALPAGRGWTRRRRPRVRRAGPCAMAEDGISPALAPAGLGRRPSGAGRSRWTGHAQRTGLPSGTGSWAGSRAAADGSADRSPRSCHRRGWSHGPPAHTATSWATCSACQHGKRRKTC